MATDKRVMHKWLDLDEVLPQHDDEVPIYHKKEDRDTLRGLWQLFRDIYGTLYTTNLSVEQVEQFGVNAELFVE